MRIAVGAPLFPKARVYAMNLILIDDATGLLTIVDFLGEVGSFL